MKLYLSGWNINNIKEDKLKSWLVKTEHIDEIYSDEGIFVSKDNEGFRKLDIIDGNIKTIPDYLPNSPLIIDETYIYKSKNYTSRIPYNHRKLTTIKQYYKESSKSPVTLVLEHNPDDHLVTNAYFMMMDKHGKYTLPDINNQFTRETIELLYSNSL